MRERVKKKKKKEKKICNTWIGICWVQLIKNLKHELQDEIKNNK